MYIMHAALVSGKDIVKQLIQGSLIFLNDRRDFRNELSAKTKKARYVYSLVTHTKKMSGLIQTRLELRRIS